jgi:hypothetical protein
LEEPGELTKQLGRERREGEGLSIGPVVEGEEGGEGGRVGEGTEKERERERRGWLRLGWKEGREGFDEAARGGREGAGRRRKARKHIYYLLFFPLWSGLVWSLSAMRKVCYRIVPVNSYKPIGARV